MELTVSSQEAREIVKGLMVLRDRAYSSYRNHKDPNSDTAQKNLKHYEELESLRMRLQTEAYKQSELRKALADV